KLETCNYKKTALVTDDNKVDSVVYDPTRGGGGGAGNAAEAPTATNPSWPRFVAGCVGPTNRTASISPDVNNAAFRSTTFDDLVGAYYEQTRGLMDGRVDLLLIETVFDTINAKAALFAFEKYFEETGLRVPVMVSVTITDNSGSTFPAQTIEPF